MEIKDYLRQVGKYDAAIDAKLEELRQLKSMVTRITASYSSDTGSGGSNNDKLGSAISKIVDLENEIDKEVDLFVNCRNQVCKSLESVSNTKHFQVLHKRYIEYKTWEQIAIEMGKSYQWVCKLHGRALQDLDKKIKKESDS